MQIVFWVSAALLAYTFVGYPLLMKALARLCPRPPSGSGSGEKPSVSVVVAAHDAGATIAERIANLQASDYPADRLEIVVASDGSSDDTVSAAESAGGVRVLNFDQRRGKPACLNDAIPKAAGEIVVLADARQRFDHDAITNLVAPFADPDVGAVSGELMISASDSGVGEGIGGYWKMERALRADEAQFRSAIGCTGAIYAIRRELFRPIPADSLIDDVLIPMQIAEDGSRVLFERAAKATDPQALDPQSEFRRKRRTIGGNFQLLFRHLSWCTPWGHPLWWQLISHKFLRLAAPLLLIAALVTSTVLARESPVYAIAFGLQGLFYILAAIGITTGNRRSRLLSLPSAFVFLNAMTIAGLCFYLKPGKRTGW